MGVGYSPRSVGSMMGTFADEGVTSTPFARALLAH